MKRYIWLFLAGSILAIAGCCSTHHDKKDSTAASPRGVPAAPWSVEGEWDCTHPAWKHRIKISSNGEFYFGDKDAGRWTIASLQDHVILVLAWRRWPAETVTMVEPDEFRGKVSGGELIMRRVAPPKGGQ